jgi:hypothetical protein
MANIFDQLGLFEDQFEAEGDGYLYRKNSVGAPIRVTTAERDRYVNLFSRSLKRATWGMRISVAALLIAIVVCDVIESRKPSDFYLYAGSVVIIIFYVVFVRRARNFPTRELRERYSIGEPRSKAELRERMTANIDYWTIAMIAAFGVLVAAGAVHKYGLQSFEGVAALAYCTFMLVCSAIITLRKVRLSSRSRGTDIG